MMKSIILPILGAILLVCCKADLETTQEKSSLIYVGTYTKQEGHVFGEAKGIHIVNQLGDGKLDWITTVQGTVNPSFLTVSADGNYLLAVGEVGVDVDSSAYIDVYKIINDSLEWVDRKPTYGQYACHVSVNSDLVAVSNYVGGVSTYKIDGNGKLSDTLQHLTFETTGSHPRQDVSHPHSVTFSKDGKYAYICDLGGDRIYAYGVDTTSGKLNPLKMPEMYTGDGSGPRHMTIHPDGKRAYVVLELSSEVLMCDISSDGFISRRAGMKALDPKYDKPNTGSEIVISPNGRYMYYGNRGQGSISIFSIGTGTEYALFDAVFLKNSRPRSFMISPDGNYLHVGLVDGNKIQTFQIRDDGRLKELGMIGIPTPACLIAG